MQHNLKINKVFFPHVLDRTKTFEIRKNDRKFCIGDKIVLSEWDEMVKQYTGRSVCGKITFITDFEQKDNYVVFSFEVL